MSESFKVLLRGLFLFCLGFSSLGLSLEQKLLFVDKTTGTAYEWSNEVGWLKTDLSSLLLSDPSRTDYRWGSVRLTPNQRVEISHLGFWKDTGLRPPPSGITYRQAILLQDKSAFVELGGTAHGFNYISPQGKVIVYNQMKWKDEAPPILEQLIPYGAKNSFLAIGASGKIWEITPPDEKGNFEARELKKLPKARRLFLANGTPVLQNEKGEYRQIRNRGKTDLIDFGIEREGVKGEVVALTEKDAIKRLEEIKSSVTNRGPPESPNLPAGIDPDPLLPRYGGIRFSEYQDLVKKKVSEIPELKDFWSHNRERFYRPDWEGHKILFGGGRLRGLLKWIDDELTSGKTVENVMGMEPPFLAALASQAETDKDLLTLGKGDEKLKMQGWDTLTQGFAEASTRMGGPTLEKVFASPTEILDPYNALLDFANGRLEYHIQDPETYEKELNNGKVWGNSRVAQAMRYLRFVKEFPKHQPSAESEAYIKSLATSDDKNVLPKDKDNWWIYKAMKRLYGAHENAVDFMATLREWKLLDLLVKNRFVSYRKAQIIRQDDLDNLDLTKGGWKIEDVPIVARFLGQDSPESVFRLKMPFMNDDEALREYQGVIDPPLKTVSLMKIKALILPRVKHLEQFTQILMNDNYNKEMTDTLLHQNIVKLMSFGPTVAQLLDIDSKIAATSDTSHLLKTKAMELAKNFEDVKAILNNKITNKNKDSIKKASEILIDNLDKISSMTSFEELKMLRDYYGFDSVGVLNVSKELYKKAKNTQEMERIVEFHYDKDFPFRWNEDQKKTLRKKILRENYNNPQWQMLNVEPEVFLKHVLQVFPEDSSERPNVFQKITDFFHSFDELVGVIEKNKKEIFEKDVQQLVKSYLPRLKNETISQRSIDLTYEWPMPNSIRRAFLIALPKGSAPAKADRFTLACAWIFKRLSFR